MEINKSAKSGINAPFPLNQTQQAVMSLFAPFIDEIVDRVSERVLSITQKEPRFYSRQEVSQMLHISLPTLARLTKDGLLVAKRVGSRILYDAEVIDDAVKRDTMFKYKRVYP